jgi:acetate---CoA ligase (ADP-forming)
VTWYEALFRPRCVAVVGSLSEGKIGRVLVDQLLDGGFSNVVTVNPQAKAVHNLPSAGSFQSLVEQDFHADLAVIASPANTVADVLDDAGSAGVRAAVIITAGFSETGHVQEEEKLVEIARRHGVRLVGPNCAGLVNTRHKLFPTLETRPPAGEVTFLSQSGALGGAVLSWAEEQGVGFSKFVSYGNAADLTEVDFLEHLREDEETRVVALYMEAVSDGRTFLRAASELASVKPLIVIKSGRSSSGMRATRSHTGSLAGEDAVYDAALRQCGAIRVSGIEEMFDLCRGFVHMPPPCGRRLAIVTNSGGPAVLAADAAEIGGLDVVAPSASLRQRLTRSLSPVCSLSNPFDLTVQGTEAEYRETTIEVLREYDAVLALNVNTPYLDSAPLARGIVSAAQSSDRPVVACFMAGAPARAAQPVLCAGGVPAFFTGERAVRVLASMATYASFLNRRSLPLSTQERASVPPSTALPWPHPPTEPEAMEWIEEQGFPVIDRTLCRTARDAVVAFRRVAAPVAMKLVSPGVLHKTDVGGVALELTTQTAVKEAFEHMRTRVPHGAFEGVLITPMVHAPVEALVGLSHDAAFGPVIAVGLGGIYAEVFRDVSLCVAPVSRNESRQMIEELRSISLLQGARGQRPRDLSALAELVSSLSHLPFRVSGIQSLDLNPVFVLEQGCVLGDVRVIPRAQDPRQEEARTA